VLEALARALHPDEAERAHLFDLARALGQRARRDPGERPGGACGPAFNTCSAGSPAQPRSCTTPAWTTWPPTSSATPSTPTCSAGPLAWSPQQRPLRLLRPRRPRLLRRLGPRRQRRRRRAALSSRPRPYDRDLSDLVGDLSTQRTEFRTRWAAHNVRFHDTGSKDFHHPVVGDLTLTYNRMELAADPGQALTIWAAEPGSKSAEALSLLGSWAATPDEADSVRPAGPS
jgi:hypothetical protein